MFIRLFKHTRPSFTLIILVGILLWIPSFFEMIQAPIPLQEKQSIAFSLLHAFENQTQVAIALGLVMALITGFSLVLINSAYFFIAERTFLPAFIYMLLTGGITSLHHFHPFQLSTVLMLWVLSRVFGSYRQEGISMRYFDAGFIIALAALVYNQALFFILFVMSALIILRIFRWREWLIALIGLALPFVFLYIWQLFDSGSLKSLWMLPQKAAHGYNNYRQEEIVFCCLVLVLILYTSGFMVSRITTKKIQNRKFFNCFLWIFLISSLVLLLTELNNPEWVYVAAVPVTYLFTNYLIYAGNKQAKKIILIVLTVSALGVNYYQYIEPIIVGLIPYHVQLK